MLVKGRFGALFEVGAWWRSLRANFGGYMLALGVLMGLYMLILLGWQILYFTLVLCLFAPLLLAPVVFYAGLVYCRLVGQAYGETLPAGPVTPARRCEPELRQSFSQRAGKLNNTLRGIMRTRFLMTLLALAIFLGGCSGSSAGAVQAVDAYYKAILAQNADQLKSVTCPNFQETAQTELDSFQGVNDGNAGV